MGGAPEGASDGVAVGPRSVAELVSAAGALLASESFAGSAVGGSVLAAALRTFSVYCGVDGCACFAAGAGFVGVDGLIPDKSRAAAVEGGASRSSFGVSVSRSGPLLAWLA